MFLAAFATTVAAGSDVRDFNVPEAAASNGLKQFARQAHLPLLFLNEDVRDKKTNTVKGAYTVDQALHLLLEGTGIEGHINQNGVLTVTTGGPGRAEEEKKMKTGRGFFTNLAALLFTTSALQAGSAAAQTGAASLEEVLVTAQRREQSLQEVPISIEAVSGAELRQQGYRTMDDLADFSPTVEIDIRTQDQDISIRGMGTTGNNLTLEQAAPTFLDGIHFGRTSMIKSAFLDLERIEILRGPQPVYFGQNATAGAFNLTSRKPGPEWQADITAEVGNFGRKTVEGGVGGPVTDTVGVRVAGKWDRLEGYLTDIKTGDKFPRRTDKAGRITLQWAPTDNFEATAKFEAAKSDSGGEGNAACLTQGAPETWGYSVFIPGANSFQDDVVRFKQLDNDCFSDKGIQEANIYYSPPTYIDQEDADTGGVIDLRDVVDDLRNGDIYGRDDLKSKNGYLNLDYRLDNGIEFTSLTGWVDYDRSYVRGNSNSPFLLNLTNRAEKFSQWSEELRVTSPVGGRFEWMVGGYWEKQDLDLVSDNYRGNTRRGRRLNLAWQDAEWKSVFATVTFNFLDDKASIDLGGRYTDVKKTGYINGYGSQWVFDVDAPSFVDEDGDPVATIACCGGFYAPWRSDGVPDEWDGRKPIGATPLFPNIRKRSGPYLDTFKDHQFDPQVVLRYRPTQNISTYAKWAQAFKSGGFDTGKSSLPDSIDKFKFKPEFAENWEIGAKGSFLDNRLRASLSLFWMEVKDLQIATTDPDSGSESTNAGLQRVRGAEFDLSMAVTNRLTAHLAGAWMDGTMVSFKGAGCTDFEDENAATGPCLTEAESIALIGSDDLEGTIDRSGAEAPRTPDWKIALKLDYWQPVLDRYKWTFNGNFVASDGYIDDVEGFTRVTKWDTHADMNLALGFGDVNDTWHVAFWVRHLLEAQPSYHARFDVDPDAYQTKNLGLSNFRTYGVQFQYNYN